MIGRRAMEQGQPMPPDGDGDEGMPQQGAPPVPSDNDGDEGAPPAPGTPLRDVNPPGGEQGEEATPEEQASYEQAINLAMDVIYPRDQQQVSPAVLAHLQGQFDKDEQALFAQADPPLGQSPNDALSATAVMIVMMIDNAAEQAGHEIPDASLHQAGQEILGDLAEVMEAMTKQEIDQDALDAAWYRALDLWRIASPRAQRQQESLQAGFEQVVQADKDGTLDRLIPGISGAMKDDRSPPQAQAEGA